MKNNLQVILLIITCCFLISLAYVIPLWLLAVNARKIFSVTAISILLIFLLISIPYGKLKPAPVIKGLINFLLVFSGLFLFIFFVINEKRLIGFVVIFIAALITILFNILWNKLKNEK